MFAWLELVDILPIWFLLIYTIKMLIYTNKEKTKTLLVEWDLEQVVRIGEKKSLL